MALEVKLEFIDVDYISNKYLFRDITGEYSVNNLGGYGTPNPSRVEADQEIDSFIILITRPDSTTLSTNVTSQSWKDPQAGSIITEYIITDTIDIQDGNYTFSFTVNEQGGELDSNILTKYLVNTNEIESKINSKILKELDFCSSTLSKCSNSNLVLWSYYKGLKAAIDNEDDIKIDYLLTKINSLL